MLFVAIAGLDPEIHPLRKDFPEARWMPGSSPGMTSGGNPGGSAKALEADWQGIADRPKRPGTINPQAPQEGAKTAS
jgi:hypothetical protein